MTFSPQVLQSDRTLQEYLSGKETIQHLKNQAKIPYVEGQGRMGALEVTWIAVTTPLRIYGAIFLKATGYLLVYVFDARKEGMHLLATAAQIQDHSLRWAGCFIFGSNLLVSTLNTPLPDKAHEVYAHAPIPVDIIPNEATKLRFLHEKRNNQLHFGDLGGQCAGMSNFAGHLQFQTKQAFKTEEHQLVSIAQVFQHGTGKEATLWQLGQLLHEPIVKPLFGLRRTKLEKTTLSSLELQKCIKKLKLGLHELHLNGSSRGHRMNYFKGKTCDFVFDPSIGLIALRTEQDRIFWSNFTVFLAIFERFHKFQFCHLLKPS